MGEIFKRFRFSLYFLIAIIIPFALIPTEELSGWLSALMLFVFLPAAVITFLWALYRAIKDIVLHIQGEPWPEKTTIIEVRIVVGIYDAITDLIDSVRSMSKPMRKRFFLFTTCGILLSILGLGIIIFGFFSYLLIALGTVILIVGIALVKLSSADNYNDVSHDISMHDNFSGMTLDQLYDCLKGVKTPFGTARKARMISSNEECFAWDMDGNGVVIVYPTKHNEGFYVYKGLSFSIKEYLTEQEYNTEALIEEEKKKYCLENNIDETSDTLYVTVDTDVFFTKVNEMVESCLKEGHYSDQDDTIEDFLDFCICDLSEEDEDSEEDEEDEDIEEDEEDEDSTDDSDVE